MELKESRLRLIYDLVTKRDESLYRMYKVLDDNEYEFKKTKEYDRILTILTSFAAKLDLKLSKTVMLALLNRLIVLREDDLLEIFNLLGKNKEEIQDLRKRAYEFTELFQMKIQKDLLEDVLKINMPIFYAELFKGIFSVGEKMNELNKVWDDYLLNKINPDLELNIKGDIREYLIKNNLMEIDLRTNDIADRSYSVLVKDGDRYKSLPYSLAFPKEVRAVVIELYRLITNLIYVNNKKNKKQYKLWIKYFISLAEALEETESLSLIKKWANVDTNWMKIKSPIQVGHPLEYYEDKYRNSVSIEFDLRIDNIEDSNENKRMDNIIPMFDIVYNQIMDNNEGIDIELATEIKKASDENIRKVQIHIGKQMFYFGSNLNGLSSAQIVPNDEIVSEEEGKKIFAFAEKSIDLNRAKPVLLITRKVLGTEILDMYNDLLFNREKAYLEVYDILTIGHEYGHALFKNELTEIRMNDTGNFKNIEEFKASAGGIVAFFLNNKEEDRLWIDVMINIIMRSVKLITWKKNKDLEPYYCEGLITLNLLFKSGILEFKNNKLEEIKLDFSNYIKFQGLFISKYKELAQNYLELKDAALFLNQFCEKGEDGYFLPKNDSAQVLDFVNYYYKLNEEIGRDVDTVYEFEKKDR